MPQISPTISAKMCNHQSLAFSLPPAQRRQLAIQGLGGASSITELAKGAETSRKFIYAQMEKAQLALNEAFSEKDDAEEKVLFYLPVTKSWLTQFIIVLILVCRSSYQGVIAAFGDLLDVSVSNGHIHNVMCGLLEKATSINEKQDLSKIRVAAHDEIFQAGKPVLVGCDAESTYCYLLAQEGSRDGNAWGVHLLDLRERQNLNPEHTIADGGTGLRKGQRDAWPDIPCHGDVFHALKPYLELVIYTENRAYGAMTECEELEKKLARQKEGSERQTVIAEKLAVSQAKCQKTMELADDMRVIYHWLKNDILSLFGPDFSTRQALLNFIVEELRARESQYQKRIRKVRTFLENNGNNLLQFVNEITFGIAKIAEDLVIDPYYVRAIYELRGMAPGQTRRAMEKRLHKIVGTMFYAIEMEIKHLLENTIRASSVVENLNSRLRNYFTLRRHLGQKYLTVLQFFLNHRQFMRSQREERIGKSPRELMTKESHSHWLEMLGFKLFKQAA